MFGSYIFTIILFYAVLHVYQKLKTHKYKFFHSSIYVVSSVLYNMTFLIKSYINISQYLIKNISDSCILTSQNSQFLKSINKKMFKVLEIFLEEKYKFSLATVSNKSEKFLF